METKKISLALLMLLFLPSVMGFDCTQPVNDFLPGERLNYVCNNIIAEKCYVYVALANNISCIIESMPETIFSSWGYSDGFVVENNYSVIYITTSRLKSGVDYTVGIVCGEYEEQYNQTLEYTTPESVFRGAVYIMSNRFAIVTLIFVLLLLLIGVYTINRTFKGA